MTLTNFKDFFTTELSTIYPETEIQSFFSIVLDEYLGLQRIDLITNPSFEITDERLSLLKQTIERLKKEEPIQYIIGKIEFYGLPFHVNSDVLIPRPETEELVEWVLLEVAEAQSSKVSEVQSHKGAEALKILDIGTGSGCIPITLKKHLPSATISAMDISEKALKVAQRNTELNQVDIQFIEKNILETEQLDQQYDVIVSNPPYVRELEKAEMKNNVLNNEPELALFVEDHDPLIFYRKIAGLAKEYLNENGILFFEINQYLGKEMLEMLRLFGYKNVLLKKDLFGNDRMIKASV